jgi:hypothetical protein
MKTTLKILILLILVTASLTARQKSDRATVEKFEKIIKELTLLADSAKTAQDCADIYSSLSDLQNEFAEDKDLLDRSLYPDNYSQTIQKLTDRLTVRKKDLSIIDAQIIRIGELEIQVRGFSTKADSLALENEKLLGRLKMLTAESAANKTAMDSMRLVIAKLRQNLKERDQVIFSMLDSLFLQYDKNVTSMNEIEKQGVYGRLEKRNVLTNIKKSITDNLNFLESTSLSPSDYAEAARQNQRFANHWKGLGPKLADIYLSGKQKKYELSVIDSMLVQWSEKVNTSTWRTLGRLFSKNGFAMRPFSNGNEFTSSFTEFATNEIKNVKQAQDNSQVARFEAFRDSLWKTELEPTWLPILVESGKLTSDQKKEIEDLVMTWQSAITPTSPFVYIFIGIFILAIVWSVVLYRRKNKSTLKK